MLAEWRLYLDELHIPEEDVEWDRERLGSLLEERQQQVPRWRVNNERVGWMKSNYRLITFTTPRVRTSMVFSCSSSPSIFHESTLKCLFACGSVLTVGDCTVVASCLASLLLAKQTEKERRENFVSSEPTIQLTLFSLVLRISRLYEGVSIWAVSSSGKLESLAEDSSHSVATSSSPVQCWCWSRKRILYMPLRLLHRSADIRLLHHSPHRW